MPYEAAAEALDRWIGWARHCRIPSFVRLQKRIVKHKTKILTAIEHNTSTGLIASTNTESASSPESRSASSPPSPSSHSPYSASAATSRHSAAGNDPWKSQESRWFPHLLNAVHTVAQDGAPP